MKPGVVTWGNVPVPYTAVWSGEYPLGAKIETVAKLGGYAFLFEQSNRPGSGKPQFSTFHVGRAVHVLSSDLCQICLGKIGVGYSADGAWCIGFGNTINGMPHITDGLPMCRDCCALALAHCPRLQSLGDNVEVFRVFGYGLAPAVLGPVDPASGGRQEVNDAMAAWRGPRPIFGTPKIYLEKFIRVRPSTLVAA